MSWTPSFARVIGIDSRVARSRPEKKGESPAPAAHRVPPMELQIGDRLADETGEWEVISRPYTTAGGKTAHVRVQRVGQLTSPICGRGARTSASA